MKKEMRGAFFGEGKQQYREIFFFYLKDVKLVIGVGL